MIGGSVYTNINHNNVVRSISRQRQLSISKLHQGPIKPKYHSSITWSTISIILLTVKWLWGEHIHQTIVLHLQELPLHRKNMDISHIRLRLCIWYGLAKRDGSWLHMYFVERILVNVTKICPWYGWYIYFVSFFSSRILLNLLKSKVYSIIHKQLFLCGKTEKIWYLWLDSCKIQVCHQFLTLR